jgi:DnaJ-domain-containing protein 1
MTDEARAAKRAYMREWRKKNPDKVKANNERYWTKKYESMQTKEAVKSETSKLSD